MVIITDLPPEIMQMVLSHLHNGGVSNHPDYNALRGLILGNKNLARLCTPWLYDTIVMHAVPRIGALILTLAKKPELGRHIRHITLEGDIANTSAHWALLRAKYWIRKKYLWEFYHFLKSSVIKQTSSTDRALAMLLVFSPEVRTLSWTRERQYAAVTAIFKYKQILERPELFLAKLESFTYFGSSASVRASKPKERGGNMEPFFVLPQLKHVSISHIRCTDDYISISPPSSRGASFSRLPDSKPSDRLAKLDDTCVRSYTFDLSRLDVVVMRSLLKIAPQLESLTLTDHFFEVPEFASAGIDTTLATLGDSLKQVPRLRKLEIRHREKHPFREEDEDRGRIGSLKHLVSLEELTIDPAFLLGDDYEFNQFLSDQLPQSIKTLCLLPRGSGFVSTKRLRRHVEFLIANKELRKLDKVEIVGRNFRVHRINGDLKIVMA